MKSGFKILWTDHALEELRETFEYLEDNWTKREIHNLSVEIERTLKLISFNPNLFIKAKDNDVRRAVVMKLNSIYYRKEGDTIEILSFFLNRKNPKKLRV